MGLFKHKTKHTTHMADTDNASNGNGVMKSPSTFSSTFSNASPAANASIPDIPLPRAPDPNVNPAAYLRSIYAVRERSKIIMALARKNQLRHFNVDMSRFPETAQYVVSIIKVCRQGRPDTVMAKI